MIENMHYMLCLLIATVGIYGVAANSNYIKKLISLSVFQAGVIMFFLAIARVQNGSAPILECLDFEQCSKLVANPLPQVLMLTAIVVGVATLAVGLALTIMIKAAYHTIEEDEIINEE